MDVSLFLARVLSLVYLVVGIGILLNTDHYRSVIDDVLKSVGLRYVGGVMALVVGYMFVTFHNKWDGGWTILVTLVGWIALIKGVLLLVAPRSLDRAVKLWASRTQLAGLLALILGLVFGYFGYLAQ